MSDFDYGNPRLRAMKSRLLSARDLETMASSTSLEAMIAALSKTSYDVSIKQALNHAHGLECVFLALRLDLLRITSLLQEYYPASARDCIDIILWRYDIQNLKAVLRGKSLFLPSEEIIASLLPAGVLSESVLIQIARSSSFKTALDTILTLQLPFSSSLLELIGSDNPPESKSIEFALERWYFKQAMDRAVHAARADAALLTRYLQTQADHINLMVAFRLVGSTKTRPLNHPLTEMLVPSGSLSAELLKTVLEQDNLEQALEALNATPYYPVLQKGWQRMQQSGKLSAIEDALRISLLQWSANLIPHYPFGIGVPLGFLSLKQNEIRNLRWIAVGIQSGLTPEEIGNGLEHLN